MQLLAEFEHSREVLTWDENVYGEALLDHVRQLFQIPVSNSILLQKFDKDWDEWINLKFGDVLHDRTKLKCCVSVVATPTAPPESAVDSRPHSHASTNKEQQSIQPCSSSCCTASPAALLSIAESKMTEHLKGILDQGSDLNGPGMWQPKHELIQILADTLYCRVDTNPTTQIKTSLAKALVDKYPQLKNRIGKPESAWVMKINNALKTKRFKDPKVEVKKRKRKLQDETTEPQYNVHRGEIPGWQPDLPHNDSALLSQQKEMMKRLTNKKNKDTAQIKDLMDETYAHRRKLINDGADVSTIKEQYAALFCIEELYNEFNRLTGVNMDATFLKKFPSVATRLVAHANAKKKKTPDITRLLAERAR